MKNCPRCGAPMKSYQTTCSYCDMDSEPERTPDEEFRGDVAVRFSLPFEWFDSRGSLKPFFEQAVKDKALYEISKKLEPYLQIQTRDYDPVRGGVEVLARIKHINRRLEEICHEKDTCTF